MTRSNLYVTLSSGERLTAVAESSSAPEQGYIVETLILPLLDRNDAGQEIALLEQYCTMNELRANATYRYALNLPKKKVSFYEERYDYRRDIFVKGKDLTQRYTDYLKRETEIEVAAKQQFINYSNRALIARANSLPDFNWDDEGVELQRRRRVSNGAFNYEMKGNTLVILCDDTTDKPEKAAKEKQNQNN